MVSYADSIHFIGWLLLSTILYLHFSIQPLLGLCTTAPFTHSYWGSASSWPLYFLYFPSTDFLWWVLSKVRGTVALIYFTCVLLMLTGPRSERLGFSLRNSLLWLFCFHVIGSHAYPPGFLLAGRVRVLPAVPPPPDDRHPLPTPDGKLSEQRGAQGTGDTWKHMTVVSLQHDDQRFNRMNTRHDVGDSERW